MNKVRVAACQYPIERVASWEAYAHKIGALVREAADAGAELLLFPEYGALELTALFDDATRADLPGQLAALQKYTQPFLDLFRDLARAHGLFIVAPSFPWREGAQFRNRVWFCTPGGNLAYQDKRIMTRFERESWGVSAGDGLTLFETPLARIGVLICYEAEFPLPARALVEAGAELLLVPSCTDTPAGYTRVRIGCMARALEGQCYVVQSPTVGDAPWSPAVDVNLGRAAVYCPADVGLPESGIVAEGAEGASGWLHAELDLARIRRVRRRGQVLNWRDWPEQAVAGIALQRLP